jgi:hypothetical protein
MKSYDYKRAYDFIEQNKESIESVTLGMHEDWFWTADTVFEDGEYQKDLTIEPPIGGITGSSWATPVMQVNYKDGTTKVFNCYTGDSSGEPPFPIGMMSGVLSGPVNEAREDMELSDL